MDLLLTLRGFKATEVKGEYWILSTGEQHVCFIKVIVLGHGVSQCMLRGGSVAAAIVLIFTAKATASGNIDMVIQHAKAGT